MLCKEGQKKGWLLVVFLSTLRFVKAKHVTNAAPRLNARSTLTGACRCSWLKADNIALL